MHRLHYLKKSYTKKRKEKDYRSKKIQSSNLDNMKRNKRKSIKEKNKPWKSPIIESERLWRKLRKKGMILSWKSLGKTKVGH